MRREMLRQAHQLARWAVHDHYTGALSDEALLRVLTELSLAHGPQVALALLEDGRCTLAARLVPRLAVASLKRKRDDDLAALAALRGGG